MADNKPKTKLNPYVCKCGEKQPELRYSNEYDIPYGAGYNEAGTCIYIDSRLPRTFKNSIGKTVDIHKYLVIHELTEKSLIDKLGLDYQTAHSIAQGAETLAILKDGIDYDEYYGYIGKFISYDIQPQDIRKVPLDLDETPYISDKLDKVVAEIRKLKANGNKQDPLKKPIQSNLTPSTDKQYSGVNAPNALTANDAIDDTVAF